MNLVSGHKNIGIWAHSDVLIVCKVCPVGERAAQLPVEVGGGPGGDDLEHHVQGVVGSQLSDTEPACLMKCLSVTYLFWTLHNCLGSFVHDNLQ